MTAQKAIENILENVNNYNEQMYESFNEKEIEYVLIEIKQKDRTLITIKHDVNKMSLHELIEKQDEIEII